MAGTIYALLVGIDTYPSPITPLQGCVADVEAMHTFLRTRVAEEGKPWKPLVLINEQATRQALIESFFHHLGQAGPGDIALFYYSGHGSQARTAPEFFHLEPDRLDETIVCYDSRTPGQYDLADKEISKLIAEVAKRDTHVVVILDSCHSGSATRHLESMGVRRVPTDDRQRPLSSYLVTPTEIQALGHSRSVTEAKGGWMRLPHGKHVVLSACQADEEAKEIRFGTQTRGVFSYYLMETLQSTTNLWTYRDVFARVNTLVRTKVARQSPLIEATDFTDLDRPFLGGTIQSHAPYFTASFDTAAGWIIDGGAVHGIPSVQGDETTVLVLFPVETTTLEDSAQAIGDAWVTEQQPTRCRVAMTLGDRSQPDIKKTYKAVVTALPIPALGVRMEGDEAATCLVREALRAAGPTGGASLLVCEVTHGEELCLMARDNRYQIRRVGDERPLSAVVEGWSAEKAREAVEYLEHIARWMHMAQLSNPVSTLPPNAVRMEVYLIGADGQERPVDVATNGTDVRLYYAYRNAAWHEPEIKLKLTNLSNRRLYCMLFNLTDRFKIWAENLLPGGGIWLGPGEETWACGAEPIAVSVPDALWQDGMTEYKDVLKLIASTVECQAERFQQGSLEVKYAPRTTRGFGTLNTLERLLQRIHTRDLGARPQAHDMLVEWMTVAISLTTVRPLAGASLPATGQRIALTPQLMVMGPPGWHAHVRLTTTPLATRDMIQAPPLPVWLRDDPSSAQPFLLAPSSNVEAGLNVLELHEVSDYKVVTAERPLIVRVDTPLTPNEHVLPLAYDPESAFYLPLGRTLQTNGGTEIRIERLPQPAVDRRSLTGSIKIFFHKVFSEWFGTSYPYPLLGTLDPHGDYTAAHDKVCSRVAAAQRILLYVHGIIGDTHTMATSAYQPALLSVPSLPALAQHYDLILTFDYENIHTPIEENARGLKQRLQEVSLGAGHGKTLHIIAHSMGGLVSRWFIEREGGNTVVQHLVMVGTPNAGSPWPMIQDWATAAIGLGLNGLTAIAWPAKILGALVSAVERVDVTLDQMAPQSAFLKNLATSPDPGIPYTVLAGNTSLLSTALLDTTIKHRLTQLFEKLSLQHLLHGTATLAFFGEPNDMAVSVASITNVPAFTRLSPPREVGCDHLSYFSTEAGLRVLAETLEATE